MRQYNIQEIKVEQLFGLYSYNLKNIDLFDGTIILYGDNGVGKSTILRMVFDLLSISDNKGHRSALRKINFTNFEVKLESGVLIKAEKRVSHSEYSVLHLSIIECGKEVALWDYASEEGNMRHLKIKNDLYYFNSNEEYEVAYLKNKKEVAQLKKSKIYGESIYMEKLREVVPATFILNADRRLDGDSISDGDEEVEYRRIMRYGEPKSIQDLMLRSREIALTQALLAASRWISRKAVLGANQGADNVHSTYVKILRHIVAPKNDILKEIEEDELKKLKKKIIDLGEETKLLSNYELTTALDMSEFTRVLQFQQNSNSSLSIDLLKPYIESLDVRLEAVRSIYIIIDRFITIINELLTDKNIGFHLSQGFYIENKFGDTLSSAQLSSGEQQLLLLFCNVLIARDKPSLFIIDEPEISLNIKWQRKLIHYLLEITQDTSVQFMFASHSLEIISQHRHRVVKLVNNHE